ncbi:diaminopimelate epimerase [Plastoroseomonas arctica]|uniref:Diaminopimelate epimerase n=1 Tax=Plastoroseomonas arctica TaxID=1509237 RepID=A0AAF1K5X5_9PROT|nr:diaminopimelate epimerase [Plastoroseomonas arctica]MBR0657065.1 diaminopimelate epimerase [Plastoroseomonas arctica]
MVAFTKMHGLGNDFVVLDERAAPLGLTPDLARRIADRHFGIGCDQLISLEAAPGADVFIRIRNPDGSDAGACGNATRCVASLIAAETGQRQITVRTIAGDLPCTILRPDRVVADMGAPRLGWHDVPLAEAMDTLALPIAEAAAACSMGNPHATLFVDDIAAVDIGKDGPLLEHHPIFPERANIGFAQILAPDHIRLAMWERGAGQTLACGSGACAAIVNAHRRGMTRRRATISMPGGDLILEWRESDGHVLMEGPVATAFTGSFAL